MPQVGSLRAHPRSPGPAYSAAYPSQRTRLRRTCSGISVSSFIICIPHVVELLFDPILVGRLSRLFNIELVETKRELKQNPRFRINTSPKQSVKEIARRHESTYLHLMHGNELFSQAHPTPIKVVVLCSMQRVVDLLRPDSPQIQDSRRRLFRKFTYERIHRGLSIFDPTAWQPEQGII